MSLLSYSHWPTEVTILSDGITIDADHVPDHFASKAVPVPHLGVVIAGLGNHWVLAEWVRMVTFDALVEGMDDLADLAEVTLPGLARRAGAPGVGDHGENTVIYHFGWSPADGGYVRDVFASERGFARRRHTEPGFELRPNPRSEHATPGSLDEWVALIERTRAEWAELPPEERIELGGRLVVIAMVKGRITVTRLAGFDDAGEMFAAMRARLLGAG